MKKRYQSFEHHEKHKPSVLAAEQNHSVVKQKRRFKKPGWKLYLGVLVVLFLGIIGYLGVNSISAANNVLSSNITLSSLLKQSPLKQTDGVTNILLLGKGGSNHPGGQLTDSIMLIRYKEADKKVAMISVPRDLWVTFANGGQGKINEAYSTGFNSIKDTKDVKGKQAAGAKATSAAIEKVTGVTVHYSVTVDFEAFKDLVDGLGGVTVNVEKALSDPYYPADNMVDYSPFKIAVGLQKLDGKTALKYARSRETTSDFDRAKRQQNLIYAIKEKMLTLGVLGNPVKLSNILQGLGTHISTTFSADEIKELAKVGESLTSTNVVNKVIDNDPKTGLLVSESDGSYHLVPKTGNFTQIHTYVKNIFNEADSAIVSDIEVYNASGVTGQGGKFAELLKADGLTVTKIENYPQMLDKTKIEDGSNNSKTLLTIKAKLKSPQITTGTAGTIKVILGKDYGN
jgi:LCP family protein required for cell wall assembly